MKTPGGNKPETQGKYKWVIADDINEISQEEVDKLMASLRTNHTSTIGKLRREIVFEEECSKVVDKILEDKYGCKRKES